MKRGREGRVKVPKKGTEMRDLGLRDNAAVRSKSLWVLMVVRT